MRFFAVIALLGSIAWAGASPRQDPVAKPKLWAGVSVSSPATGADEVGIASSFMLSFALVNDGGTGFAPSKEVDNSKLLVNGQELKEWDLIVNNGPREVPGTKLLPGQSLRFGKAMGSSFAEPGIYKVKWKGTNFESAELVFRILPKKVK